MNRIGPNDRVTLHYRIQCGSTEVVNTFGGLPETFTLGTGAMDPRLEFALKGLAEGQRETLELEVRQAFGEHDPARVQGLARAELAAFEPLETGQIVHFTLPNGDSIHGTLTTLEAEQVEIDFNHPLAGYPITFEVEIVAVDKANATHT